MQAKGCNYNFGRSIPGFPNRGADLEDGLSGVESACVEARLAADTLSASEKAAFPEHTTGINKNKYLYIRNQILCCWNDNPQSEVTKETAAKAIQKIEYQDTNLIHSVWTYLQRRGVINHGDFKLSKTPPQLEQHIAVIGGGISGIVAAKQLRYLGFKVTVFEAMERFGGRICTSRAEGNGSNSSWHSELGAMVITGLTGNPIHTLSRQFRFEMKKIKNECPLYCDGERIDRSPQSTDRKVEELYNKVLEAVQNLRKSDKFKDKDFSLGSMIQKIIALQERNCVREYNDFWTGIDEQYKVLAQMEKQLVDLTMEMVDEKDKVHQNKEKKERATSEDETCIYHYYFQKHKVDLSEKIKMYEELKSKRDDLEKKLIDRERTPPPRLYMNHFERRLMNWHIANLEYANATSINDLSMKNWDQDDAFEFPGDHYVLTNGYDYIIDQLGVKARDLGVEFKLGQKIERVVLGGDSVSLSIRDLTSDKQPGDNKKAKKEDASHVYESKFSAIVCTVPLGILKTNTITFNPQLPHYKLDAIQRLGYGNLNKVALYFEERFWDDSLDTFGCLGANPSSRGEFYLFWSVHKKEPVLMAMLSGNGANVCEDAADDLIVRRAITILKEIFGQKAVTLTKLKGYKVTRWKKNPFIRGAYSYMAVGSSGDDYDALAAPVETEKSGIFFGGEHTNRSYPATVHGAYLSGLREAGRIADKYLPTPYKQNIAETDEH